MFNYISEIKRLFLARKSKIKSLKKEIRRISDKITDSIKERSPYLSDRQELRDRKGKLMRMLLNKNESKHFELKINTSQRARHPNRLPSEKKIERDKYLRINQYV